LQTLRPVVVAGLGVFPQFNERLLPLVLLMCD
jgi:hypothetical protein